MSTTDAMAMGADEGADELTVEFAQVSEADLPRVGGKGKNLGAMTRAGIPVPPGYCVTTAAYERFIAALPDAEARFAALESLSGDDVDAARAAAAAMRAALDLLPVPPAVEVAIVGAWRRLGSDFPLAVRSSATAEDLPGASFAGQQDTYLNIRGEAPLLDAVRRCWISLFTDRAVIYRAKNRFGHRGVRLAVVVQRLIDPEVSGILFTADPVSGRRGIISIDAGFGLGEALVSGLIAADLYQLERRSRKIVTARPGDKAFAIRSIAGGGTRREELPQEQRRARALSDAQVLALGEMGERVEAYYGGVPQDIEWCIAQGQLHVVQARPITSLYPIVESQAADDGLRIFASFGHVQMMLDAMPKLALEVWRYFFPVGKGGAPGLTDPPVLSPAMPVAGSRIYVDLTDVLRVARARAILLAVLSHVYENMARGAAALCERPEFRGTADGFPGFVIAAARIVGPVLGRFPAVLLLLDPDRGAEEANRGFDSLQDQVSARIRAQPTPAARIRRIPIELNAIFAQVRPLLAKILGGIVAHRLLARLARGRWADGVRDEVDVLLRGLPGNVTTEMDLAVGDLTDLARQHPALIASLKEAATELRRADGWKEARSRLVAVSGGPEFLAALDSFLDHYGVRGVGEIDISRPRWRDDPSVLLRVITGGVSAGEPGSHRRQHRAQVEQGQAAAARLSEAAGRGLAGPLRRFLVSRFCRVARAGMGLREHPKFMLVRMLGTVRAEALAAAAVLVERGQLAAPEDVFHLDFAELASALDDPSRRLQSEVAARSEELRRDQAKKPPFVISSDGETPTLAPARADLPDGAMPGTAASSGVVEGIARVVRDPNREVLQAGEILVAPFTDPGWTPLFVHAAGVVTEVGGLMTHGAVVAREYGIPAVVSVAGAVDQIRSGQRIRVDGTRGFVQILEDAR